MSNRSLSISTRGRTFGAESISTNGWILRSLGLATEDVDFRTGTGSGAPAGFRVRPEKIKKLRVGLDLTREDQEMLQIIIEAVLSGVIE